MISRDCLENYLNILCFEDRCSVVYAPRLRAFETCERWMTGFSDSMILYFVGRYAAELQYKQIANLEESTGRIMGNFTTLRPGRTDQESDKLNFVRQAL